MGRKINPKLFRLGLSESWNSRWYAGRDYAETLRQDVTIRSFLKKKLKDASLENINIERSRGEIVINITAAKPGIIIGRGGSGIEDLKKEIVRKFMENTTKIQVNVSEVPKPNLSAPVIVQSIAEDIEKRIPFRRVMKQNIEKVMKAGAQGVKIILNGRLNGVDIARTEKLVKGKVPVGTLRSDIGYSRGVARTTYGAIGVKVWIYKGEYFGNVGKKKDIKKTSEVKSVKLFGKERPNIQKIEKSK